MALESLALPSIDDKNMPTGKKLQAIYEYMMQLNKQLRYVLQNLGEENLSAELQETIGELTEGVKQIKSTVSSEAFATYRVQTDKKLESKADATYETEDGEVINAWSQILQTATEITAMIGGDTPVGAVENTSVSITQGGVDIKTGGTFTVESGNFSLDERGVLNANGAQINGDLYSEGNPVLTSKEIYVGSVAPKNKTAGMVWIKPMEETSAQTTHTWSYTQGGRYGLRSHPITADLTGTAAAAIGSNYTYEISVPVYLYGNTNTTLTVSFGGMTFSQTISGGKGEHRTVRFNVTGSAWAANSSTISMTISSGSDTVCNFRATDGYQIKLVSRSSM